MTDYFVKLFNLGWDSTTKKPNLPPCFPGMFVELAGGSVAYVISRDVSESKKYAGSGQVVVLPRSPRGGWQRKPIPITRKDIYRMVTEEDPIMRGIRQPRASVVAKLKLLVLVSEPNVEGLEPPTEAEEVALDPTERRRRGLCLSCGDEREPDRKAAGIWTCKRCGTS